LSILLEFHRTTFQLPEYFARAGIYQNPEEFWHILPEFRQVGLFNTLTKW